jgi:hypothetical protein
MMINTTIAYSMRDLQVVADSGNHDIPTMPVNEEARKTF